MNIIVKVAINCLLMIVIFFSLMVLSHTIPSEKLYKNVRSSIEVIENEGLKHKVGNIYIFRLDNFTDALMLNAAISVNSADPINASMINKYYLINDERKYIIESTKHILNNNLNDISEVNYFRYWHGYQILLRPLLLFTDYSGIRIINYICFSLILIYLLYFLLKKCDKRVFYSFIISMVAINFFIIPLSIQFSTAFYISFLAIICMLLYKEKLMKKDWMICFFITIGGVISFFDLLTIPLLTLGLPLIIYLVCIKKELRYKSLLISSISWMVGYSIIWISKWILVYILTGFNSFEDALQQILFRTSTSYGDFDMSIMGIISYIYHYLVNHHLIILSYCIIGILIVSILIYFRYYRGKTALMNNIYLLIIACMPFMWYLVLRNHSVIHAWFVWRSISITIFSFSLFLFFTLGNYKKRGIKNDEY